MNETMNIGFIAQFSGTQEDWRDLEDLIKKKVKRLIYVKKVPVTVKLEINENFPTRKGENDRFSDGKPD